MKPEERKALIHDAGKHKIKAQKQNPGWWEDIIEPSKRRMRRQVKEFCQNLKGNKQ